MATGNNAYKQYRAVLGRASNEVFAQFFIRIYKEIGAGFLATFSKLKYLNSQNFDRFRNEFCARFISGFLCPASTFENVKGDFPIGFIVWNINELESKRVFSLTVFDKNQSKNGKKKFYGDKFQSINRWIKQFDDKQSPGIVGYMENPTPDFQNNNYLCILNEHGTRHNNYYAMSEGSMTAGCVYFSVRHCIEATWLNDRDQFLHPNDGWLKDFEFQSDCLAYTLFHGQNRISCQNGTNHWIPFTEAEVNSRGRFDTNFMTAFIAGKIDRRGGDLFSRAASTKVPLIFSDEAKAVFDAGRELWRYYHSQPKANPNASFYDIRGYFQGFNDKGKMNKKSSDEKYNQFIAELRRRMKFLAARIEPKIYEHGFLLK